MLLSVIIPSYNHETFVLSTIRAAERIDVVEKEIIVIDDGSKDASAQIIRDYIEQSGSSCIRLIARENRGLVYTLNESLSMAKGKYLYAVASDDIPIPDGVTLLVQLLESSPSVQFAMGNVLVMFSETQKSFRAAYGADHHRFFALPAAVRLQSFFFDYPTPLLLQGAVFRMSALLDVGGWRNDIAWDDLPMFWALLSRYPDQNQDFGYYPETHVCLYRQHQVNTYKNVSLQFAMVEEAFTKLCPPEWRNLAIARKAAFYSLVAIRRGNIHDAVHFVRRVAAYVGRLRALALLLSESFNVVTTKISRDRAGRRSLVAYSMGISRMD